MYPILHRTRTNGITLLALFLVALAVLRLAEWYAGLGVADGLVIP